MDATNLSNWIVLVVDDEPDSLEVLVEVLTMYDATVHAVSSAHEAMAKLSAVHPNLVITDLSMPDMDGYQLLYRIRHMEGQENFPIVALTAHAMAGDRERILAAGFTGYVSKPLRIASFGGELIAILIAAGQVETKTDTVVPASAAAPVVPAPESTSVTPAPTPVHPAAELQPTDSVLGAADNGSQPTIEPVPIIVEEKMKPTSEPPLA